MNGETMRHTLPITAGLSVILLAAACGGGEPPQPPGPDLDSMRIADSIAAERARQQAIQDSIARERARIQAEEARAREEAERAAREMTNRVRQAISMRINFDFDRSDIRSGDMATLDTKLAILQANPNLRIQIVGHCDERGSDEYNIALGNRRALAAKRYLTDRGIAEGRIETLSRGEEQPLMMGATEDAWAQNRRDEFVILGSPGNLTMPGM